MVACFCAEAAQTRRGGEFLPRITAFCLQVKNPPCPVQPLPSHCRHHREQALDRPMPRRSAGRCSAAGCTLMVWQPQHWVAYFAEINVFRLHCTRGTRKPAGAAPGTPRRAGTRTRAESRCNAFNQRAQILGGQAFVLASVCAPPHRLGSYDDTSSHGLGMLIEPR